MSFNISLSLFMRSDYKRTGPQLVTVMKIIRVNSSSFVLVPVIEVGRSLNDIQC